MERRLAAVTDGGMEPCDQQGPRALEDELKTVRGDRRRALQDLGSHVASPGPSWANEASSANAPVVILNVPGVTSRSP